MSGITKHKDQQGMVSILVTMIMIIVISLIVLGFAQVTRRNQREALDNQLSTQAYYAAESGVNAAVRFFAANPLAQTASTGCKDFVQNSSTATTNPGLGGTYGATNVLNNATGVRYTCLTVNSQPATLQATPLTQDSNLVWHVQNADNKPFTSLTFQWADQSTSAFTGHACAATSLPAYLSWNCPYGILRVDLVDVSGGVNNASLEANATTKSIYMIPTTTTSGVNTAVMPTAAAQIVNVHCASGTCSLTLTMPSGGTEYYARMTTLYQDSDGVTLSGTDAGAVSGSKFINGQAVIDSTGQAQDELRRVQVRIPLVKSTTALPGTGLQSTGSVCKQLNVAAGVYADGCPND